MAKPKLTREAIRFIVETYDSQSNRYTYSEIADLLRDKYRINISLQAVQQNYHKYKGRIKKNNTNELIVQEIEPHQNHYLNEKEENLNIKHSSIRIKIQIS